MLPESELAKVRTESKCRIRQVLKLIAASQRDQRAELERLTELQPYSALLSYLRACALTSNLQISYE